MDHVWVLNNDTRVSHDALTHLVLRVQEDPTIGICGSTLVYAGARDMLQALAGASYNPRCARSRAIGAFQPVESVPVDPSRVERDLAYVNGAAMFVTRAFLERVGLMDETYFLYSEEHDWAHRGRSSFRLGYAPQSVVYHRQGATIGTNPSGGSDLSLFYLYRSKVLFTKRHYARYLLTAIAAALWDACKFVMKRQPGKAGAVMRGLLDARTMKGYMTGDAA
jgi:GT2 family glycosyltransferase